MYILNEDFSFLSYTFKNELKTVASDFPLRQYKLDNC